MPIPSPADQALADLDNMHAVLMTRLRTWRTAPVDRDPANIWAALQEYSDAILRYVEQF